METKDIETGPQMLELSIKKEKITKTDPKELRQAEWVNVKDEMPKHIGFYFVLTDEHLTQGVAFCGHPDNEDGTENVNAPMEFDIWWATGGKEPKVMYWLKDHMWGMIYEYKKEKGEIK